MTRNRLAMIGLLALALAAFVSMSIYKVLRGVVNASHASTLSTVVAVANSIPAGAKLQEKDLRLVKMPVTDVPPGAFHSTIDAAGRAARVPMAKGELVMTAKLADLNGGAGLSALIPAGMRAVSVKVNDVIGVAGFVTPGTHVDVVLTGQPARSAGDDPAATTILENVQVLAAGQNLPRGGNDTEPQNVAVITLLVSPEDAQKLALATQEGKIQLALRNPLDGDNVKTTTVRNSQLYRGAHAETAAVDAKKPRGGELKRAAKTTTPAAPDQIVVELIRGDKRDTAKFDREQ
jgi:pilus assembly protein CpaB